MRTLNRSRAIRGGLAAGVVAAGIMLGSGGVASAAKPATQACVGESLSALASTLDPGAFGAAVSGFAQDPQTDPGLGDGLQALQAGLIPDDVVPNTCNP